MSNESPKILTEEELQVFEKMVKRMNKNDDLFDYEHVRLTAIVASHRSLNARNHNLVLENDELMAENEQLKIKLAELQDTKTESEELK